MSFEIVDRDLDVIPSQNFSDALLDQLKIQRFRMVEVVMIQVLSVFRPISYCGKKSTSVADRKNPSRSRCNSLLRFAP